MSTDYISVSLRRTVRERANDCCEYCLIPESAVFALHEIDHIISQKHGGLTKPDNLALACTLCNKHKGSDLASLYPETGEITPLYHPRRDLWPDHLQMSNARLVPLTPVGYVTIQLLQLNRLDRIEERKLLLELGILRQPSDVN
jgi:hypothetical protein